MTSNHIPQHVAIIADGNRRWAREKGLPTLEGHRRGLEAIIKIGKKAQKMGIKFLTVWGFSTENWDRSKEEVSYLMKLFENWIDGYRKEAIKNKIRIVHIGRKDRFNDKLKNKIIVAEKDTKHFTGYTLVIALDYGGRDEIIRGIQQLISNGLSAQQVNEEVLRSYMDTAEIPDVDLIIRTGGEQRISGFYLWEGEYAELLFIKKTLPDFSPDDFEKCVYEYSERQRRFGK